MKKIIINESQFKRLILEADPEGPGDGEDEEEVEGELDDENYDEDGNFIGSTEEVVSPNVYIDNINLEGIVVTFDKSGDGSTSVSAEPWKYKKNPNKTKHKSNWWKTRGIDTTGLGRKISKFASNYIKWMEEHLDMSVGPVVTSGYRGPKRQIDAMYTQWKGKKDYIEKTYPRSYEVLGKTIEHYFNSYKEGPAKRAARNFLKKKEKEGKYISNHQLRGAIDISLFKDTLKNDEIKKFLDKAKKNKWIVDFLDERDTKAPHFHIKLA